MTFEANNHCFGTVSFFLVVFICILFKSGMSYRKKRAAGKTDMWVIGQSPQKITKFYTFGKQLGQAGAFGEAFLVTKKDSKEVLACKVISKAKFNLSSEKAYQYGQAVSVFAVQDCMALWGVV